MSSTTTGPAVRVPLQSFHRDPLGTFIGLVHTHGNCVRFRMGPWVFFLLNDPESIRDVLSRHAQHFTKGPGLDSSNPLIGRGLLTQEGEDWAAQRRRYAPIFKSRHVDLMHPWIGDEVDRFLDHPPTGTLDAEKLMLQLSLACAMTSIFGIDAPVPEQIAAMGQDVQWLMAHFYHRSRSIWRFPYHLPGFNRRYHAHARSLTAHIERLGPADRPYPTVWPVASADPTEKLHELATLVIAGYETTGHALAWTLQLLAQHPATQDALYEESCQSLAPSRDTHPLTWGVLQEAMRLYPPVWLLSRRAAAPGSVDSFSWERGQIVLISPWILHHTEAWHPNPDAFWPDRFRDHPPAPFTYIPFGAGPRRCIGEHLAMTEALTALPRLLRRLRVTPAPGRTARVFPGLTLGADGPLWLTFTPR